MSGNIATQNPRVPAVGNINRISSFRVVVFPAPFAPGAKDFA